MTPQLTERNRRGAFAEYQARSRVVKRLAARRKELTKQFPNQWIALYHDGEAFQVFAAASQEELIRETDERGLKRDLVAIAFLETEKQTFIL